MVSTTAMETAAMTHQQQKGRKREHEEAKTAVKSSNSNAPRVVSSKSLAPPTTPDAAFPRGGQAVHRRPGSDRPKPMEVDNGDALDFVKASAANSAAASSRRGMSSPSTTPSASSSSSSFVPPLRRSNLVPGARLLGVVTSVTPQKVEVALPTGLRGSASRNAAAALPAVSAKAPMPPLSSLYRVGQVVRCAVVGKKDKMSRFEGHDGDSSSDDEEDEDDDDDDDDGEDDDKGAAAGASSASATAAHQQQKKKKKKHAVLLTMAPAAVAGALPRSALFSGNPVVGWIASEEDHGFVVDLGSPGVTGFLPREDAPRLFGGGDGASGSNSSTLPPSFARGAQLDLVVASDGPSAGTNVVRLKAAPQAGAGPPSREPPAADAAALRCLPVGALVSATVTGVSLESGGGGGGGGPGAGVHLKFWTYLSGAADAFALPTLASSGGEESGESHGSSFSARFAVGTKHRARVVFVDAGNAKAVRLSLLPHVVARARPSPALPAVGTLLREGTVRRVDEGLGVLVEFPRYDGGTKDGGNDAAAAAVPSSSASTNTNKNAHPATQSLLGYAHVSNVADGRVASLARLFKAGDAVAAARVVGARPADALAALSLAPAATAAGTLGSAAELRVGETVRGVVEAAHASRGLLVSLAPGVRARVPIEHLVTGEPGGASAVAAVARRPVGAKVSARVFAVSRGEGGGDGSSSSSSTRATLTLRKPLVAPGGDASAAPKLPPILSIAEAKPGSKTHGVVTGPAPGGWHRGVFVSLYGGVAGVVSGAADLGLGPRAASALAAAAAASAAAAGASSRGGGASGASAPAAAAATAAAAAEVASALPRGTLVKARVLSADAATGKVRLSLAGGGDVEGDGGAPGDAAGAAASAAAEDAAAAEALNQRLSGGYSPGDVIPDSEAIKIVAVEREEKKKGGGDVDENDSDDEDDNAPPSAFVVELPSLLGGKKKKAKTTNGPLARILRCHLSDSPTACAALASSLSVGSTLPAGAMVLDVRAVGRAAAAAALAAEGAAASSASSSPAGLLLPITVSITRKASMLQSASSLPRSNEPDALSSLAEGQLLRGFVASLTPSSAFVRFLGRATGRAPLPRSGSGGRGQNSASLAVGDSVSAVVTAVDAAAGRFSLSLKGGRAGEGEGGKGAARALGGLFADLEAAAAARAAADGDDNGGDDGDEPPSSAAAAAAWPSPGAVVEAHPSEAKPYGLLLDLEEFPDAAALAPAPRHHFDGASAGAAGAGADDDDGGKKKKKKSKKGGGDAAAPSSSSSTPPEPSMPAARTLRARVLDVAAADGVVDVSLRSELLAGGGEEDQTSSPLPAVGSLVSAVVELSRPEYLVLSFDASSSKKKGSKKGSGSSESSSGLRRLIGFAPAPKAFPLELGSAVEGVEVAELPSAASGGRLILSLPASLTENVDEEDAMEEKGASAKKPPKQTPAERAAARAAARAAEAALAAEAVQPGTLVSATVVAVHPLHAEVRLVSGGGEGGAGSYSGRQGRVHATEARDDDDDGDDAGDDDDGDKKRSKKRAKKASSSSKPLPLPFAGLSPGDEIRAVVLGAAATPGGRAHGVLELSTRASLVAAAEREEKEAEKAAEAADANASATASDQAHHHRHHLPRASLRPRVVVSSLAPGAKVRGFVQEVKPDGAWIALTPTARARLRALDAAEDLESLAAFSGLSSSNASFSLSAGSPVDATVLRVVRRADGGGIDVDLTTLPVTKSAAREAAAGDLVLGFVKSLPASAAGSNNGKNSQPAAALGDGCVRVSFSASPHAPVSVGRVSLCDLRDEWRADALAGIFVGTAVRCRVLEEAGSGRGKEARLSLRASDGGAIAASSSSAPSPSPLPASLRLPAPLAPDADPSSLRVGDRVAGYVAAVGRPGAFVALSRGLDGRVPLRDLASGFVPEPAAAFPPGTLVVGRVAALVPGGKVQLTLRGGVVPEGGDGGDGQQNDDAGAPLGAVAALLLGEGDGEASAAAAPAVRVGAVVAGRVRRVEAFGVFVDLDCGNSPHSSFLPPLRAGLAHVSELADEFVADPGARFRPGQRVTARVLKVDAATGRVSLSLRPSAVKGEPRPEVGGRGEGMMEDDEEEEEEESDIDDHVGEEEEEEEDGGAAAEMELDGGSDSDASEDASDGDARDDEGGSDDSDSPSAGLDSDDDDDGDEDDGLDALRRSAGGISRDNSAEFSEEEEEEEEEGSDDDDASYSDDESEEEEEEDSDVDARLGAAAAGGGRAARSPAPSHRVSAIPSSSSGLGGLDVGLPVGWGEEEEDDDGDDDGDIEGKPSTPAPKTPAAAASESSPATASLSKAAKRRAERAAAAASEAATDAAEKGLAARAAPADEASFRRALAASPNSSFLWIRYVAHLLSLGEADRARAALAAALDAIALEATADRFNVWVAALNLEATHGGSASSSSSSAASDRAAATMALFRKAARHTDAKKLHLALVPILERAGLGAAAVAAAAAAATKAFPTSCKVWLARHAAALRAGDAPAAAAALRSATVGGHDGKGALPPRKHVKFLSRAAVAEFKNSAEGGGGDGGGISGGGSSERGRELFEKLLAAAPKRLDLWAQYIDQEVSLALAGTTATGKKKRKRAGGGDWAAEKEEGEKKNKRPDPRRVRALFARGTALDLPPKKMKFLFRRALEFEKRLGDEAGADRVREAARAYVAKVSGGGGGGGV